VRSLDETRLTPPSSASRRARARRRSRRPCRSRGCVTRSISDVCSASWSRAVGIAGDAGREYGPAKCWPIERFGELAARITGGGRQVWIFGSDKIGRAAKRSPQPARGARICVGARGEDVVDLSRRSAGRDNDSGLMPSRPPSART
jgi:hypothetical protein